MVTIARVSTPENGLAFKSDKVKLKIGTKVIDTGNLYICANSLAWQPENASPDGISISWREISVHGISNEPKCIYFMLDHKLSWRGVYEEADANGHNGAEPLEADMEQQAADEGVESDEDEGNISDENDSPEMTECWLLPEDLNIVEAIYQSMTYCQSLHPDPADSPDDLMDNDDDEDFDDDDDVQEDNFGEDFDADGRMQNLNLNW